MSFRSGDNDVPAADGDAIARKLARALHVQGRLSDAESAYRIALYDSPEDGELYLGLGDCLRGLGRRADALDAYVAAVEFEPGLAAAHYGLGLCELHPLRRAHAFGEATRWQPNHVLAHLARGEALLVLGRCDEGLAALRAAQALNPDDLEVVSRAGESLISAGLIHDGAQFLEQAIAEHPIGDHSATGLGRLYRALAQALAALGRHHDAADAYRAADYLLPDEQTDPGSDFSTAPSAPLIRLDHFAEHSFETTDPDVDLTDPDGEITAPPN